MIYPYFIKLYRFVFARKSFYKVNYHINRLSLRGMGILNSEGEEVTGEYFFIRWLSVNANIRTVFDIGANTGNYSILLNNNIPNIHIFAYEPHPETFKILKKNTKKLTNIKIYNLGLDNKVGDSVLWDFSEDSELKSTQPTSTLASNYKNVIEDFHNQKSMKYKIKTTTIEKEFKTNKLKKIDLIQIDTEGSELKILENAKNLIKNNKIRIIQFEFNEMNVYSNVFMKNYFDLLKNYNLYRLLPNGFLPLGEYKPDKHEIFAFQNIVAINKKDKELLTKI